jgi:lambda family phage portal protein
MSKRRGKTQARIVTPVTAAKATEITNRYDGASNGRRMGSWNAPSSGPNRAMAGLQTLRNRSRDAIRNEWQAAAAVRVRVANLIGTGIVPRPDTKDEAQKERITAAWTAFTKLADADGLLDYYGMQSLATRSIDEGGEVFIRARPRRANSGYGVPVQFQLLEPEMVPLFDADSWPYMPQGNKIRQGVEFNRVGQRVAYWCYKEHPGDEISGAVSMQDLLRIPAEFIRHVFKPLRIGQIRGVPSPANGLAKLRVVTDFDDAVLARQHTANLFTGFVKKLAPTGDGIDPISGRAIDYDEEGAPMASLEPGTMQELLPGEDVVFADPPDAGTGYGEFMRWQLMGLSAGDGIPYELLTGDLKDVSDRTIRIILNEFHRACEQEQWQIIIPGMCDWVYAQWVKYAYLSGGLSKRDAQIGVTWSPHAWAFVHPVQDVQGKQLEIEIGLKSRSQVISERGDDPQKVDAERAADKDRELDLGLTLPPPDPNAEPPSNPAQEEKTKAETDKVKAESALFAAKARRETTEADAMSARLRSEAARLDAETELFLAQSDLQVANTIAVEARAELDKAESAARLAELTAADARASAESEARIAALEDAANLAREDAARKADAQASADTFVAEQRDLVLQAERTRAAVAAAELEAARLGLEELRQ